MKKIVALILTLLLFSTTYAEVRVVDTLETRNNVAYAAGEDKAFSGKLIGNSVWPVNEKIQTNYKDGVKEGLHTSWHSNGQKHFEIHYINGVRNGMFVSWNKNGKKEAEGDYTNGQRNGLHTLWSINGQKKAQINYTNGQRNGLYTSWYSNGQKASESNYTNGQRNGLYTSWYRNGQKEVEGNYTNDRKSGLFKLQSSNEDKESIEFYIKGKTIEEMADIFIRGFIKFTQNFLIFILAIIFTPIALSRYVYKNNLDEKLLPRVKTLKITSIVGIFALIVNIAVYYILNPGGYIFPKYFKILPETLLLLLCLIVLLIFSSYKLKRLNSN